MENTSGLEPRGVAVLIREYTPERRGALIEIPDFIQSKMALANLRAEVIAIGPNAWHDEKEPRANLGDRVMVTQFAGVAAIGPKDGKQYRLVNDRDIFCRITDEGEQNGR